MRTKTITLNEEEFNIVLNAVGIHLSSIKNTYNNKIDADSFINKIDKTYSLLKIIPYNEEINS